MPVLSAPDQQSQIKNGDLLLVSGQGEAGASVLSARLVSVGSQTTAQQLPSWTVSIDPVGQLSGAFLANGLAHGDSVALEVILQARGTDSLPASSRSIPLVVDNLAPTNAAVTVQEGSTVGATGVSLSLSAIGASEVFIDGDLDDGGSVRRWLELSSPIAVSLGAQDGGKAIIARFRDGAHNTTQALSTVTLDTSVPISEPTITGPWGVAAVKNGDSLALSGETTSATPTALVSAFVLSLDGAGAILTGAGCQTDVSTHCQLSSGKFSGTFSVGTPCSGATQVAVRIIVRNAAGIQSIAAASLSNQLALDNDPPIASVAQIVSGRTRLGYAASTDVHLSVSASDSGGYPVQMLILGDLSASARSGGWVDFPGPVADQEQIALTASQGPKNVSVKFRDIVHNEIALGALAITLDTSAPAAPLAMALSLIEQSPQPTDPAQIADTYNTFSLMAGAGAIVGGDRVDVYGATGPTQLLTVTALDVAPDGSFANQDFTYVPGNRYYVVAVDPAGNTSPATAIDTPRVSAFNLPTLPSRAGAVLNVSFDSPPLAATPRLVLGGRDASFQSTVSCGVACTRYRYTFTPAVSDPEGAGQCVVRMIGQDGRNLYAATSAATDATTTTFDFHGPTINDAALVITQSDPGTQDTVAGQVGAVSDNISPTAPTGTLTIFASDSGAIAACNPCSVGADGSFGPIALGDNAHDNVLLSFVDQAGNSTTRAFNFDRAPPAVTGLTVAPSLAALGQLLTVTFTVSDAHDLRALPVVTLAGRNLAWLSGTTQTSSGSQSFTYQTTVHNTDPDGRQLVSVLSMDAVGNVRASQVAVILDKTPPVSSITWPQADGVWNGAPGLVGTATDGAGTGVAGVELTIRDDAAGLYWDGAGFTSVSQSFVAIGGTTAWSYQALALPLIAGHHYTVSSRATDALGNVEVPSSARSFTFDAGSQAAPTGLTAVSQGEAKVHLSWTPPITGAPTSYRLYYDSETATRPPYAGVGASQGGSPVSIAGAATTYDVTELPRGRYAFALSAVGPSGESVLSNEAAAASRWWINTLAPLTRKNVNDLTWVDDKKAIAVGPSGTIWRTIDRGASFSVLPSPTTQDLRAVSASGNTIIVVGNAGTILRSQDGGASFTALASPTGLNLLRVLVEGSNIVIAGSGGGVLYSNNNGDAVIAATVSDPPPSNFTSIWRNGSTVILGTASSGIYVSVDGGLNVARSSVASGGPFLIAGSGANVVAAANGLFATSSDGGTSWTSQATVTNFTSVVAASATRFLLGSATAVQTVDMATLPPTLGTALTPSGGVVTAPIGLLATSTSVLAFAGASTQRSTDAGQNWLQLPNSAPVATQGPLASMGSQILAASSIPAQFSVSSDDAETWVKIPGAISASTLIGVAQGTGALVSFDTSGALKSDTQGASWARVFSPVGAPPWTALFGQGSEFIAIGAFGSAGKAAHSTNGGVSWSMLDISSFAPPGYTSVNGCSISTLLAIGSKRLAIGMGTNNATLPPSPVVCYSEYQGVSWFQGSTVPTPPQPNAPAAFFTAVTDGTLSFLGGYRASMPTTNGMYMSSSPAALFTAISAGFGVANYRNVIAGGGTQWLALSGNVTVPNLTMTTAVEASASTNSGSTWATANLTATDFNAAWASGSTFIVAGKSGPTPTLYRSTTGPTGPWAATTVPGITSTIGAIAGTGNTVVVYDGSAHLALSSDAGQSWTLQTHFAPGTSPQNFTQALVPGSGGIIVSGQNGTILQLGPQ